LASERTDGNTAMLELGVILGQNHAFGLVAGRCSAAQAEGIRRLREEKLYKQCCEKWEDFCSKYLKMSRTEADRLIRLLDEFGPIYFELSQLTRISPETFRAIAPAIQNGVLRHNGEAIALNADNSHKVAAAVAEIRSAIPKKAPALQTAGEVDGPRYSETLSERIAKLDASCLAAITEFEKLANEESIGGDRALFNCTLRKVRDEFVRVAYRNGVR
jgi:hypothetical protein